MNVWFDHYKKGEQWNIALIVSHLDPKVLTMLPCLVLCGCWQPSTLQVVLVGLTWVNCRWHWFLSSLVRKHESHSSASAFAFCLSPNLWRPHRCVINSVNHNLPLLATLQKLCSIDANAPAVPQSSTTNTCMHIHTEALRVVCVCARL